MRFKIYLEYRGTNYAGWQQQKDAKTIQGTLIKCVTEVLQKSKGAGKLTELQGSGRTDRGVHAIEQVAHLECSTMLAPEILKMKVNDLLPSDINVLEIEKAKQNFHARHSATARQYLYVISKRRTAFEKNLVWWIKDRLDVSAMNRAASEMKGMHDFISFAEKLPEDKSTLVDVKEISVTETGEKIFIRIKASHFLWKMVRRITGVLAEAGRGNISYDEIQNFLKSYSKEPAFFTAPPSGLFLEKVYY
ncbi:MAG TPA: tRNA pseudouridine(38-40) synthase TruA [Ignavibacteria bacterium]|nr:tRNA pseudouridine(38-40) synthase TruA [Ignavibacteria bacterium]